MFQSYHQPSFIYGTDTMPLNKVDMDRIEVKYRKVLKCMLSLPDCTSSAAVYLSIGVLPATAQRDIEILGLLGQLAMCDQDTQKVKAISPTRAVLFGEPACSMACLTLFCIYSTRGELTAGAHTARERYKTTGTRN